MFMQKLNIVMQKKIAFFQRKLSKKKSKSNIKNQKKAKIIESLYIFDISIFFPYLYMMLAFFEFVRFLCS